MIQWIKDQFKKQGYIFYDDMTAYYLNIFSVRTRSRKAGFFDDYFYIVYRDSHLKWRIEQYECTTDPGLYWLKHPLNVEGTAILIPGQYIDTYRIDMHNGKQQALCQRLGKVRVVRDSDRDGVLSIKSAQEGYFGINIHGTYKEDLFEDVKHVGKWSAGCTVMSNKYDFKSLMKLSHLHSNMHGNSFTYTLFNEDDFDLENRVDVHI